MAYDSGDYDTAARLDFRSDTRTVPDAEMRAAMAHARVGDDVYGDDPTVSLLEKKGAVLLGTEAALFVPTGTMANLLAVLAASGPRRACPRVLTGAHSHMSFLEDAGLQRFAGADLLALPQQTDGLPDVSRLNEVLTTQHPDEIQQPTIVCVENTSMMHGGSALEASAVQAVADLARGHGAHVHLDGARLANAAIALKVPPAELARPADSVTLSVSKGLGAPAGTLLGGTLSFVARARELREKLGGSLHQVGVLAAPALVALRRLPELADDHATAALLASQLSQVPGADVSLPPHPTNIVMLRCPSLPAAQLAERLARQGVQVLPLPDDRVRFVVHRAHDADSAHEAARAVTAVVHTGVAMR
ncbi:MULTISPECIES: threonine aldolase family protein [Streptomyces]|uniref:threonine aldolase family protein n=1 Tax=Streptomyces TaxID=1883 RepID=UPI00163B669E|nr:MULTISPECIES: GntG family PLP-dependent aldolase [Streptomyces]MBC2875367.1 aminotransferase class I/II-fold pyridoxal phosphate-dependent enzyme [Streptomyces sp. TYQ1024]UBI35614.1 aminotransferase class I/II-fold pyridoxal phosphate-dependent enzyme [Streptomyces mobaraensis]UKW28209.1 aminotransferase class I/II-fold pyridoxal phosphate-dependent enzyme [Streptomyces sp. TYQ1024]